MKKILALCLTLIMVVSSLAMVVSAAEMITITVPAQTLVNGKFYDDSTGINAALTAVPDEWDLSGTYTFGANGIRATNYNGFSLYKKEAFDTKGANYEFSVTMATYSGKNYVHFGAANTTDAKKAGIADTGYTLYAVMASNYNHSEYTLYKNGVAIEGLTLTDNSTTHGYQTNRTFKFKVTSTGMTITGPFVGSPLTVEDAEPITTGYVGAKIVDNNGSKGNLKAMSLVTEEYSYEIEKPAEAVTGAKATYEKPGKAFMDYDLRGASALPAGVTAGGTYTLGASGLTWGGNPKVSTSFGAVEVDADATDFTVEARYTAKYNGAPVFNFLGYSLSKSGDYNGTKTYTLKKGSEILGTGTLGSAFTAGNALVKVAFSGNNITVTVDGTDVITATDANVSKSGNVSIDSGYTGSWTVGGVKIASPATNVTKNNFLMDKTFSKYDTIAGLSANGYSLSGVTTVNNSGVGRDANNSFSVYYTATTFEGAYTAEITGTKSMNWGTAYFNRTDASNHYSFATQSGSSTTGNIKFGKTVNGVYTSFLTDAEGNPVESKAVNYGTNATSIYKASFEPLDNGDLKITIAFENYAGNVYTYTYTDKKTDEYTPMISGYIGYANGYSAGAVKAMKVYPTPAADAEIVPYAPSFQIGADAATEIANGSVMYRFPVAMIGQDPDFIAVLYKDYEMVDIKVFNVYEANEGLYPLFDLTQNTDDNVSIAVYTWNTLEGMVPVLDTVVLD